jgi:methylated-DNA-protein-cysteine methyltransferase related protein
VADFQSAVRAVIASLPEGETFSYGWVADEAGYPGRARAVGALLAADGDDLPWWRVMRSDGRFVDHLAREQAKRLRAEGVAVRDGRVLDGPHHARRTPARPRARRLG